jgi:hypothetical protein
LDVGWWEKGAIVEVIGFCFGRCDRNPHEKKKNPKESQTYSDKQKFLSHFKPSFYC